MDTKANELLRKVRNAIAELMRSRGRRPSPASRRAYLADYRRMRREGKTPDDYRNSRNTYYRMRAAWTYGVRDDLRLLGERVRRVAPISSKADDEMMKAELVQLVADMKRYPPDPNHRNCVEKAGDGELRQLTAGAIPRPKGKRVGMSELPDGWRMTLIRRVLGRSVYALQIATCSLTGVRPNEFDMGIAVSFTQDDRLAFVIRGSKVKPGEQGQEMRTIIVPIEGADAVFIADWLRSANGDGSQVVPKVKAKALCAAVAGFGQRAFPGLRYKLSPYTFRHALASDLKGEGWPPEALALALGHLTDRTCQRYGRAGLASGSRNLEAKAVRDVKLTRSTRFDRLSSQRTAPRP